MNSGNIDLRSVLFMQLFFPNLAINATRGLRGSASS